ncbi:MAG: protoporphyrinogen/coproporphyrinogen oxidase [Dehalococcoidia bacterium]
MIVIVGGGVAGLTAARVLFRARAPFVLFEAEESVGGRVRTDVTAEGFRLDRGFQVLFTRYPAVRRHVDLAQLGVRTFTPGALIVGADGVRHDLDDPLRVPKKVWRTMRSPVLTLADKGRVALEVADLRLRTAEGIWTDRDTTTLAYLHERGFSAQAIDQFFRPFFGGIFFDRSLSTSSNAFRFTYKMLAEGDTVVPALGMGELPHQLAAGLPPASVRTGVTVNELLRVDGRVTGVRVGGELVEAAAVILAADGPSAETLSGLPLPSRGAGGMTLWFAGSEPLLPDKKVLLNAAADAFVNEAVQITNIAPDYAPPGDQLLAASIVGHLDGDDVEGRARADLTRWFGEEAVARQRLIGQYRISYGQFLQPPGFATALAPVRSGVPGLYNGGEAARASSINGAMEAGEAAALAVLEDLG